MIRTLLLLAVLTSAGCGKEFAASLEKAETAFAARNYINTIDALNIGMTRWKESDGESAKARAYELLGRSYQGLRNTDKAIDAYQQAVKLSSNTFEAAYHLGSLYLLKNQNLLALGAFQQALRSRPEDPQALLGLANTLYALNRFNDAARAFQRVIDVSPGVREALDSLQAIRARKKGR